MADEHKRGFFGKAWLVLAYFFDAFVDSLADTLHIVWKEFQLFLGTALALIGFFSFEADKFCDGNTADYLSCTRPSTFYYFDALDKVLIVLGVVLVMVWWVRRK